MSSVTLHWAAAYIGKPWRSGACGPHAYYCWGLVQTLCMRRHKVAMPDLIAGDDNQSAIMAAVRDIGWARIDGPPLPDDIVMARRADGKRHCGFMVEDRGRIGVLHADGYQTTTGPIGQVNFHTLEEFTSGGYAEHEFWRHA